jgi:hypothetical protein
MKSKRNVWITVFVSCGLGFITAIASTVNHEPYFLLFTKGPSKTERFEDL